RLTQSSAANSLSNCGGDQRPPHSPAAGRRSPSTAIEPSLPLSAISSVASRDPRKRFCLGLGSSVWRPSSAATQPVLMGHTVQAGLARLHTVAPKSMMAWVYAPTFVVGVQASACAQNLSITAGG